MNLSKRERARCLHNGTRDPILPSREGKGSRCTLSGKGMTSKKVNAPIFERRKGDVRPSAGSEGGERGPHF